MCFLIDIFCNTFNYALNSQLCRGIVAKYKNIGFAVRKVQERFNTVEKIETNIQCTKNVGQLQRYLYFLLYLRYFNYFLKFMFFSSIIGSIFGYCKLFENVLFFLKKETTAHKLQNKSPPKTFWCKIQLFEKLAYIISVLYTRYLYTNVISIGIF